MAYGDSQSLIPAEDETYLMSISQLCLLCGSDLHSEMRL